MRLVFAIVFIAILSAGLASGSTYILISRKMNEGWEEQREYLRGWIEMEASTNSGKAELQAYRGLAIVEYSGKGDTEALLSIACSSLQRALPEINTEIYSGTPSKLSEVKQLVSDSRAAIENLRKRGVCLTRP